MDLVPITIVAIIVAIAIHESVILIEGIAEGGNDYWQKWGIWAILELFALIPLCYFLLKF